MKKPRKSKFDKYSFRDLLMALDKGVSSSDYELCEEIVLEAFKMGARR